MNHHHHPNPGRRRPDEFSFETYVERCFCDIHERLTSLYERLKDMGLNIAGLEADEEVLAQAIPFLINEVTSLQAEKAKDKEELEKKVGELQAKEAEVATDAVALAQVKEEVAKAQGELAVVESVTEKLAPVVAEAEKVLPPKEPPPATSTSPTQPVYTWDSGEGANQPDARFTTSGFETVPVPATATEPEVPALPLLYFSGDAPNQTITATGGTVPGYVQYTGATQVAPTA